MRILVLHSNLPPDAPPEDLDTLATSQAIVRTLHAMGHWAAAAPFDMDPARIQSAVREARIDIVFNMVESALGQDGLAPAAPAMLEQLAIPFTGSNAATLSLAGDKTLSKRVFRAAGLPTPDWSEPHGWDGIDETRPYIVKSATEDASVGLDDGAVVQGRQAIMARARDCAARHGGRWFAEAFIPGREFNVAVLETDGDYEVLAIPEMCFADWPEGKPQIVGYKAKWDMDSPESDKTPRHFGVETSEPQLAQALAGLTRQACRLFDLRGYGRVDFRVDPEGNPVILEINPNPSIDPEAGFMAAASRTGRSYEDLLAHILGAAATR